MFGSIKIYSYLCTVLIKTKYGLTNHQECRLQHTYNSCTHCYIKYFKNNIQNTCIFKILFLPLY